MEAVTLSEVVDEQMAAARGAHSGRAAHTVLGGQGHFLRHTVIAIAAGHGLSEHESPGEATLQVLKGRVVLRTGDDSQTGSAGDLLIIPPQRHALDAVEDSAVLLTVLADR